MEKHILQKLAVSILLSLLIAFFVTSYIDNMEENVTILVARDNIEIGEFLEPSDIVSEKISKKIKERYFKDVYLEKQKHLLVGSLVLKKFDQGDPFSINSEELGYSEKSILNLEEAKLVARSKLIPYNKRVISVTVDQSGSMNQTLSVGSYVDVIFTSNSTKTGGSYSRTILQHSKIFDIIDVESASSVKNQEIMLLVTPVQATIVASAKRNGVIDLSLNPIQGRTSQGKAIFTSTFANYRSVETDYVRDFKHVFEYLSSHKDFIWILQNQHGKEIDVARVNEIIQSLTFDETDTRELMEYMEGKQ